jgi:hypothetical protein
LDWELYLLVCSLLFCLRCQSPVRATDAALHFGFESGTHTFHSVARVLLVKGKRDEAEAIMRKIYANATEEQLKLKVRVLQAWVQASIEIERTTTLWQRMKSILFVGVNRRALSAYIPKDIKKPQLTYIRQSSHADYKPSNNSAGLTHSCITLRHYSSRSASTSLQL